MMLLGIVSHHYPLRIVELHPKTDMPACYICEKDASTIDHIPPQGFFSNLPPNIIKLDACKTCNQSASLDEEYLRTAIAAQGYGYSSVAREVWEGAVKRSFNRRPKGLKARLAKDLVTIEVRTAEGEVAGHLPGIAVEGARAGRVLRKIARGIYFKEQGKRLGEDELLLFRDADVGMDYRSRTKDWPEVDMDEAFR
jgi:hypothetical protein